MFFQFRDGWQCQFLEQDLKTPLLKKLRFQSEDKIRELAKRGGVDMSLETRQALDHGIEIGRGGIWLELSEEQYQTLTRR
jgi:hypothetical protein